jgi:hypothetical protein
MVGWLMWSVHAARTGGGVAGVSVPGVQQVVLQQAGRLAGRGPGGCEARFIPRRIARTHPVVWLLLRLRPWDLATLLAR